MLPLDWGVRTSTNICKLMMIFVTPSEADNRFVIYLKTTTCKVQYCEGVLQFEAALSRIHVMKDFFLNYKLNKLEVRENGKDGQLLVHDDSVVMQIEDLDNITGLKVPVLTII